MSKGQGLTFPNALMREIKSSFHYIDRDIEGRERLFFLTMPAAHSASSPRPKPSPASMLFPTALNAFTHSRFSCRKCRPQALTTLHDPQRQRGRRLRSADSIGLDVRYGARRDREYS